MDAEKNYQLYFIQLYDVLSHASMTQRKEIMKHVDYLADKAKIAPEDVLRGKEIHVEQTVLCDCMKNIDSVLSDEQRENVYERKGNIIKKLRARLKKYHVDVRTLSNVNEIAANAQERPAPVYLGRDLMLCTMRWGGKLVCPSWNVDVAVGYIRDGLIEDYLTEFVMRNVKKDETFVNVGANFGYYTVLGAKLVGDGGKVYGFEANPIVFSVLLKTLYYSGCYSQVDLYNRAVSNVNGVQMEMDFDYQFIGGGSICYDISESQRYGGNPFWDKDNVGLMLDEDGKYRKGYGLYQKVKTKTTTLDAALKLQDHVNWILCDAESADPLVILGGMEIIKRSPDIKIIFEWTSDNYQQFDGEYKNAVENMWNLLEQEGFKLRYIYPERRNGETVLSDILTREQFLMNSVHGDYLAQREL